jgi:nicotinamidase-related amidase
METKALLVFDMIREFVTGSLGGSHALKIIPNIKKLLETARKLNIPVIFVNDAHLKGIDREFDVWGDHAIADSEGVKIVNELFIEGKDYLLHKRRYSGFYASGLDALLRDLNINALVLVGVLTNICIQHTAADAFFRNYKVIIPIDAVNALTQDEHETGLAFMKRMYMVELVDTKTLIKRLGGIQ